jgi:cholesterol oxidase
VKKSNDRPLHENYFFEEGVIPVSLFYILSAGLATLSKLYGRSSNNETGVLLRRVGREIESNIRGPYYGAVNNTMMILVMGHDDADGELKLKNNKILIDWESAKEKPCYKNIDNVLFDFSKEDKSIYIMNPLYTETFGKALISVHPLGGLGMGSSGKDGAVNHKGQVFTNSDDDEVYENLIVCDGSIVPTSLGLNPLLTICSLAERIFNLLLNDENILKDNSNLSEKNISNDENMYKDENILKDIEDLIKE